MNAAHPEESDSKKRAVSRKDVLAVAATVSAVLLPMVYQMYPTLATRKGFWQDSRVWILGTWAILVTLLAFLLTRWQSAEQSSRHSVVQQIDESVARIAGTAEQLRIEVAEASRIATRDLAAASKTVTDANALLQATRQDLALFEIAKAVGRVLQEGSTTFDPSTGSPPLPASCHFLLHVARDEAEGSPAPICIFPLDHSTSLEGGRETGGTILRVLAINEAWKSTAGQLQELAESARNKLPGRLRNASFAVSWPVRDRDHVTIGLLTVCGPEKERMFQPGLEPGPAIQRLANLAEDIVPLVEDARRLLNSRKDVVV
jgi:hypothetical protein